MLHLQIDPHSGVPVYRQLMDQVKYYVASGALAAGEQLPSIRDLARALTVNPTTVGKAYTELRHEGVIDLQHGKGVFVAQGARPLSSQALKRALRRLARQLAVEGAQMGAPKELVMQILQEEWEALKHERRD